MSSSRVAIVTGANKGIGLAIVRSLCQKFDGAVYLTARSKERGEEALKVLEAEGLEPRFHLLDVSDQKSSDALKEYVLERYGGVDVFIHNAGILIHSAEVPYPEQARVTVMVNFESTRNICNTFLPLMKPNGRFVNLSSSLSMTALRGCSEENQRFFMSADVTEASLTEKLNEFVKAAEEGDHQAKGFSGHVYGMSKLGVSALTRILGKRARSLKSQNVLVNCCCPGWVRTDLGTHQAPLTTDQGAETPVMLALIPPDRKEPNGEFVKNHQIIKWYE